MQAGTSKDSGKDPFLPPYTPGQFISDISPTHALMYNSYPICDYHLLVITKDFEH
jgi:ATP adenylyltransferase